MMNFGVRSTIQFQLPSRPRGKACTEHSLLVRYSPCLETSTIAVCFTNLAAGNNFISRLQRWGLLLGGALPTRFGLPIPLANPNVPCAMDGKHPAPGSSAAEASSTSATGWSLDVRWGSESHKAYCHYDALSEWAFTYGVRNIDSHNLQTFRPNHGPEFGLRADTN